MIRPEDRQAFLKAIRGGPHFRLIATPAEYKEDRIARAALKETLERSRIHLVGDSFPLFHWDEYATKLEENYIESLYDGNTLNSAYRLYSSGQFVHLNYVHEDEDEIKERLRKRLDVPNEVKDKLDGYLDYVWTVNRFAEYLVYVARLAVVAGIKDSWRVEISIQNPGVRAISVMTIDRSVWHLYRIDKAASVERTISASDLQAATALLCAEMAAEFLQRFGFPANVENMLAIVQKYV